MQTFEVELVNLLKLRIFCGLWSEGWGGVVKVLVVDESQETRNVLGGLLTGCDLDWVSTGKEALQKLQSTSFDLILLETQLPDENGFSLIEKIKASSSETKPIIFFAKVADLHNRRKAFSLGALDFISKTAEPQEVALRILSRFQSEPVEAKAVSSGVLVKPGSLEVCRTFKGETKVVSLTAREFKLFHFLYSHLGEIIDRETIRNNVWKSAGSPSSRAVDKHVATLRKRLEPLGLKIKTLHRLGYSLNLNESP